MKWAHAFKCDASYDVEILNSFNPELQLKDTESAVKNKLKKLLTILSWFKFVTTWLVLMFKKIESDDKRKFDKFFSHLKAETIINESGIDNAFESIYATNISNIQFFLGNVQSGLSIQSYIMILIFQRTIP